MRSNKSEILLISDLHLAAERPDIIRLFSSLVSQRAVNAKALYILGDFFEYWIGDDDPADELADVFASFVLLNKHHTPVYFQHGNRDFLVAEQFAKRTHCQLIPDPFVTDFFSQRVVLMHGDTLCTDDVKYQQFKQLVRSNAWQQDFLSKSLDERRQVVENLRNTSKQETRGKQEEIMDVNKSAVESIFSEYQTDVLIHGHTHRPAIHTLKVNDRDVTRIVLGDWYSKGSVLSITPGDSSESGFAFKLETIEL